MLLYMDMLLIKLNIKKSLSLHHKSLASELLPPPACGVNVIPIAISAALVDVTITPHIRHVAGQTNGIPTGKYIHFVLAAQNPRFSLLLRGWPRTRRSGGLLRSSIAPKTTNSSAPVIRLVQCALPVPVGTNLPLRLGPHHLDRLRAHTHQSTRKMRHENVHNF